jgi:nitrate reductase assembly molybdenum cofactor insertion protein NarJ
MERVRIKSRTTFDKRSNLEMTDFINNLKESFEDVVIVSIEDIKNEYDKLFDYEYRVSFYHNLYIII